MLLAARGRAPSARSAPAPASTSASARVVLRRSGQGSAWHHGACPTGAPSEGPAPDPAAAAATAAATAAAAAAAAAAASAAAAAAGAPGKVNIISSLDEDVDDSDADFWHRPRAPPSFHLRQNGYDRDVAELWDREKEEGRKERRQLFSFKDWKRHRSSYRYVHQLSTMLTSRVLRGLLWPVLMFSGLAALVVGWQSLAAAVASGALLAAAPAALAPFVPASFPALPVVPLELFSLVSFAMALLLGSRISTSYGRWNEARQSFGRITTTARNLFRQSLALLPPEATGARALMCRWLIAYVRCSKWYLREDEPLMEELAPWLTRAELRSLLQAPHPPNYTLAVLSRVLASTPGIDSFALVELEKGLSDMMQGLSACDRILNTPAPLMFSRHATRLLTLFLALLPLGLWPITGAGTIFAEAIVAFALTGIEEVGISIEEPLSILPLEKLCVKAERQIADMLRVDAAVLAYVSVEQSVRGSARGVSPPVALSAFGDEGPIRHEYGGPSMAAAMRERAAMIKAAVLGLEFSAGDGFGSSGGGAWGAAADGGARAEGGAATAGAAGIGASSSPQPQPTPRRRRAAGAADWAAVSSMDPEDIVQRRNKERALVWAPLFTREGLGGGGRDGGSSPPTGSDGGGAPAAAT